MLSFFPRGVLDEILNLIESVSEDFPSYSFKRLVITDVLRQTACEVVSQNKVNSFAYLVICTTGFRLDDSTILNLT